MPPTRRWRTPRHGWPADRDPIGWRIRHDLLAGRAYELVGRPDSAVVRYEAAADPRYHVFTSLTKHRIYLPVALRHLGAAEASRGNAEGAARAYRRLLAPWSDADPELRG